MTYIPGDILCQLRPLLPCRHSFPVPSVYLASKGVKVIRLPVHPSCQSHAAAVAEKKSGLVFVLVLVCAGSRASGGQVVVSGEG